tara:strand:- start:352 stop:2838 length:2487 start_codon:yes stop_codon:yes gene_type:complete
MDIDKALYQAPLGIDAAALDEEPIEIEIVNPEGVKIGVDGLEIDLMPEKEEGEEDFTANLAEDMEEPVLTTLVTEALENIRNDLNARSDWEKMYKDGIQLLGLKYDERTEPWPGACGVFHPMITEAVVRFQAETIIETFPAMGPVKTKVIGKQTKEKDDAAERVADDLNWQLTENMTEFRSEHERMLWNLPSAGSAFKKVYDDPTLGRQTSVFVPAEDVILPYGYTDMHTCPRISHRMRKNKNDILKLQAVGFWRDVELGEPPKTTTDIQKKKDSETGVTASYDDRFLIYEMLVDLDLEGYEDTDEDGEPTGIALPYILTLIDGTNKVLSIRRNWREKDPLKLKRQHFVHYVYIPGYGAYGFGLFHLIGGFAKSATSIMRQLVDAGTLSNLPGGLKSRGLRIKGDDTPIAPGEFRDVDVPGGVLRDNILPLPYKEPSQVLAGLLDKIIDEGRRFAATADLKVADMSAQAPVGTTLALLERTLKVLTAVQARVHFAFKQEIQLIAEIVKDSIPDNKEYPYDVDAPQGRKAKYDDYRVVEIIPVSDPNAATMSQRVVQYQAVIQLSASAPQIYDMPELHKQMLHVLGIKNVDKLIPAAADAKPIDPVQENQNVLVGKPVKAIAYQDHESHIQVHNAAVQDPLIKQLIGQNPQAGAIMAAMAAHIAEHVGFAYRNKISKALGAPLPSSDEDMSEEMEFQLSKLLAQAAPQVLAESQASVAQQQAQQNAQDPLIQMQQKELQIKESEVQRKSKKDMMDAAAKADEIRIKEEALKAKQETDGMRIGVEIQKNKDQLNKTQETEGMRIGVDIAKHKADMQTRRQQNNKPTKENT